MFDSYGVTRLRRILGRRLKLAATVGATALSHQQMADLMAFLKEWPKMD